jgi:LAO/AO transport system kinase
VLARERESVALALNLCDDRRPEPRAAALQLLDRLEREAPFPGAPRVGITGAPGAGKSTLLDAFVRGLRAGGDTVGIVAVDPSSRESGGALLGDRIRVQAAGRDAGVFIRSMAARERLGGLADATRAGVSVLACAFDRVFVETVGVGQSEVEIAGLVDTLVYVANPGTGDALQFMKAGLIELPDLFVVNKSDLGPAATRTALELESGLGLGSRADPGWSPPVLLGIPGDNTYANYREANLAFWRQTVMPLARRIAAALGGWLGPAWGEGLRLDFDADQVEALSLEREALWKRVNEADFLTPDEKREAVG